MIRGDLFRLEKDLVPKKSKINNTFSNNFRFHPLIFMKKMCQNPEKQYIFKITYVLEYEWQHTASLLAKSLNYEVYINFSPHIFISSRKKSLMKSIFSRLPCSRKVISLTMRRRRWWWHLHIICL